MHAIRRLIRSDEKRRTLQALFKPGVFLALVDVSGQTVKGRSQSRHAVVMLKYGFGYVTLKIHDHKQNLDLRPGFQSPPSYYIECEKEGWLTSMLVVG